MGKKEGKKEKGRQPNNRCVCGQNTTLEQPGFNPTGKLKRVSVEHVPQSQATWKVGELMYLFINLY